MAGMSSQIRLSLLITAVPNIILTIIDDAIAPLRKLKGFLMP